MIEKITDGSQHHIVVNIKEQTLTLFATANEVTENGSGDGINLNDSSHRLLKTFTVSTAKNGIGSIENTGCTPLGHHVIAKKIGEDHPINTVYVGRVPTGEIYTTELAEENPDRDWILTRIMWLDGCEDGVNKGLNSEGVCCDTYKRYIYIHGTPDSEPMGIPLSYGCVRMRNDDIIELFDKVEEGTEVWIVEG